MSETTLLEYRSPTTYAAGAHRLLPVVLVWLTVSVIGMGLGLWGCVNYNQVAGTDLTKMDIFKTTLWMNTGPFVGPLMEGDMNEWFYQILAWIAVPALILGWLPIILFRRRDTPAFWVIACCTNALAALIWFTCAVFSLRFKLS